MGHVWDIYNRAGWLLMLGYTRLKTLLKIQGVFLHWASPEKYGKPRLGEFTLT